MTTQPGTMPAIPKTMVAAPASPPRFMVTCSMGAPDSPWAGLWAQAFFNGVAKAETSQAKNKMSLNDQNV